MRWCWRVWCFTATWLTPAIVLADNCSDPGDCWNWIGGALATAAGIGGALGGTLPRVAGGAGGTARRRQKTDPCASYQRGYDQEKGLLDTIDARRQSKKDAWKKAVQQFSKLLADLAKLTPDAEATLAKMKMWKAAEVFGDTLGKAVVAAGFLEIPEALEIGVNTYHLLELYNGIEETASVTLKQAREFVLNNPGPWDAAPVLNWISVAERLEDVVREMITLKNQYDAMQAERDTQAHKVADAKAALDACRASHS